MADSRQQRVKIPDSFLARLRDDLTYRRLESGFRWLEAHRDTIADLRPWQKNAAMLLGYVALWVDMGFSGFDLIKELLCRFPQVSRLELPLLDYLHLRMAEGVVAMAEEDFDLAIRHFEGILSFANEIQDRDLVAICCFDIGRCQRRAGRYDIALQNTLRGKDLAQELGHPKMAAVMQVLESWLIFQTGKPHEAARVLKGAETALLDTDDYVSRGNVQSAYGRIARRQGKYNQALQRFTSAIEEYKKRNAKHRNLARSLANIAFVKRLLALQLRQNIDKAVRQRDKARNGGSDSSVSYALQQRARYEKLHQEALEHLAEAEEIYGQYNDHRGLGTVCLNRGLIYLDSGDLDRAASDALAAYKMGEDKKDFILMARGRALQSTVENAKFEEQLEERSDPSQHAQLACEFAREAIECAKNTQNRRLLCKIYIIQGLALSNDIFTDLDRARECADRAAALLKPESRDYVWEDLQTLKTRLMQADDVETLLHEWSQGIVGNKSFQQITEEFSAVVIPKVWKREGCKVSRVANRLSISPKKVRRILSRLGLLESKGSRG